jgi:probable rRNA maturation factor
VRHVLEAEGWQDAEVSLAVVDDPTIHELNRRYLGHDYPTDVLSFLLSDDGARRLEGEVVVSADTAARSAEQFGWTAGDELLLYVIHGTLHLAGYDDQSPDDLARMRDRERTHLAAFGLQPRY